MLDLSLAATDLVDYIQETEKVDLTEYQKYAIRTKMVEVENIVNLPLTYSLAPSITRTSAGCITVPCQKEENDMNSAYASIAVDASAAEKDQRRFLRLRLDEAWTFKKFSLKKKFGLADDDAPETLEDFLARIAAGKFTYDDKAAKIKQWRPETLIRWRDPAVKEDRAGYDAAKAELLKAFDKAEEDIRILEPEAGLAALRAFKDISVQ